MDSVIYGKRKADDSDETIIKRRRIIREQIIKYKKRPFESPFEIVPKKIKLFHRVTIEPPTLITLPNDILWYAISNFLEIEDVIKLFRVNKTLSQLLSHQTFWVMRYTNDFGSGKNLFQIDEWLPVYKIIYKDVTELKTEHEKLCYAIKNGHTSLIYKIIYSEKYKPLYTNLLEIIRLIPKYGNLELLKNFILLIKKRFNVNQHELQHMINSGLYESVDKDKLDMCEFLIKNKAQVQHHSYDKNPLHLAAAKGQITICKLLLDNGAETEFLWNECPVLYYAVKHDQIESVKLLLEYCANVNGMYKSYHPLFIASAHGCNDIVEILCKHRAFVNHINEKETTALSVASYRGHAKCVEILLKYGANHNMVNNAIPLYCACQNNHLEVARILLLAGANINCVYDNTTPIIRACYDNNIELVKLLLAHNANIECRDTNGLTPLYCACVDKYYTIVELLCRHGAQIDVIDNGGSKLYTDEEVDDTCRHILDKYKEKQ